jgi:hypothetical protein
MIERVRRQEIASDGELDINKVQGRIAQSGVTAHSEADITSQVRPDISEEGGGPDISNTLCGPGVPAL